MSDNNIERTLGNIEGKLDTALEYIKESQQSQNVRLDNHGTRLGVLERSKAYVLGIAAATSAVVGIALKVLL